MRCVWQEPPDPARTARNGDLVRRVAVEFGDGISGDGIPGGDGTVSGNEEFPVPTNENKNKPVVIASTHLFWDPAFPEVKLAQSELCQSQTRNLDVLRNFLGEYRTVGIKPGKALRDAVDMIAQDMRGVFLRRTRYRTPKSVQRQ